MEKSKYQKVQTAQLSKISKDRTRKKRIDAKIKNVQKRINAHQNVLMAAYEPQYQPPAIYNALIGEKLNLDRRDVTRKGIVKNVMEYMLPTPISDKDRRIQAYAEFTNQKRPLLEEIYRLENRQSKLSNSLNKEFRRDLLQADPYRDVSHIPQMVEMQVDMAKNRRRMENQVKKIKRQRIVDLIGEKLNMDNRDVTQKAIVQNLFDYMGPS